MRVSLTRDALRVSPRGIEKQLFLVMAPNPALFWDIIGFIANTVALTESLRGIWFGCTDWRYCETRRYRFFPYWFALLAKVLREM